MPRGIKQKKASKKVQSTSDRVKYKVLEGESVEEINELLEEAWREEWVVWGDVQTTTVDAENGDQFILYTVLMRSLRGSRDVHPRKG